MNTDIIGRQDVIIPAWNEEKTLPPLIDVLARHNRVKSIIVSIDPKTFDNSLEVVSAMTRYVIACGSFLGVTKSPEHGKGQTVRHALAFADRWAVEPTNRVILCDADITGLTESHVDMLTEPPDGMVIGIADVPSNLPDFAVRAWPWVGGQRSVPRSMLIESEVHGYLMETQLNRYADMHKVPVTHKYLRGLVSRFNMTTQRVEDMKFYREWGIKNGILPQPRNGD